MWVKGCLHDVPEDGFLLARPSVLAAHVDLTCALGWAPSGWPYVYETPAASRHSRSRLAWLPGSILVSLSFQSSPGVSSRMKFQ